MNGRRTPYQVHRVVYELLIGPIPDGLVACHKCDNVRCCNPEHLFLGTNKQNSEDMLSKGRGAGQTGKRFQPNVSGENNGRSKLTKPDVKFIRKIGKTVLTTDLAKLFKVSRSTIMRIIRGTQWAR